MDSNLSGTAFLISNSNCLLLMYKKAMVFWKLKQWSFCPRQTWYNHLLVSVSFFDCWFFGIFYREIISSVNNNSFITYFPICVPFISFSYPILLSNFHCWNAEVYREHTCLIPNSSRKTFSFSFSFKCFLDILHQVEEVPLSSKIANSFCQG